MAIMHIAGNVKPAVVLRARLDNTRHEETWHVVVKNLLQKCKIPTSGIHSITFDTAFDIMLGNADNDEEDEGIEVLAIKITRENAQDKKFEKAKKRRRR